MELNMRPYTKEGLLARQQQEQQQQQQGSGSNSNRQAGSARKSRGCHAGEQAYPDAYYEYKLAGVLVHTGTADSGHYYSYIKRRDTQVGCKTLEG